MTDEEADEGLVLTCQMGPTSRLRHRGAGAVQRLQDSDSRPNMAAKSTLGPARLRQHHLLELEVDKPDALAFLPGQYVNLGVPGSDQASFLFLQFGARRGRS